MSKKEKAKEKIIVELLQEADRHLYNETVDFRDSHIFDMHKISNSSGSIYGLFDEIINYLKYIADFMPRPEENELAQLKIQIINETNQKRIFKASHLINEVIKKIGEMK